MISSDESDEEVRVQWHLQPRRPLRSAMASHVPDHERHVPRSHRYVFESTTRPGSLNADYESGEDVSCNSDYEDSEGAPLSVHSSRESITQDELVERVLNRCHGPPRNSSRFRDGGLHDEKVYVQQSNFQYLYSLILVFIVAVCSVVYFKSVNEQEETGNYGDVSHLPEMHSYHIDSYFEILLKKHIRDVKQKYPLQMEDTWYQFLAGIKKVTRDQPAQPSSFLLLHTSDANDTMRCLTKEIANISARFLNSSSSVVTVEGEYLRKMHENNLKAAREEEDNGWFIEQYGSQMKYSRTMVVYDLEKVPATLAQAFHFFCDEVTPLMDKAVYLFSLEIPKRNLGRPVAVAEDLLNKLWSSKLNDDIRASLITRITSAAVYILAESSNNSCS